MIERIDTVVREVVPQHRDHMAIALNGDQSVRHRIELGQCACGIDQGFAEMGAERNRDIVSLGFANGADQRVELEVAFA